MPQETLTITDNRTGQSYTLPIENGTIRAMDLRQIKTGPEDFGLMTYDPGVHEHGVLPERHHLHRWRSRNPALSRISHRRAGGALHFPRGRLPAALRRVAHRSRNSRIGSTRSRTTP